MSKKRINNRLNKLFDNIKEEKEATKKQQIEGMRPPDRKSSARRAPSSKADNLPTKILDEALGEMHTAVQTGVADSVSVMSLPLRVDDRSWMTLQIAGDSAQRQWGEEEQLLAKQVTDQLSLALENARLFQETQQRSEELALVNRIVTTVSRSLDLRQNLQFIAEEIAEFVSAHHVGVALVNDNKTHLVLTADAPLTETDLGMKIPIAGNPSAEKVIETQQPLIIQDVMTDPLAANIKDVMRARGTLGLAIFPLFSGEEIIGTVGVDFDKKGRNLSQNEIRLIETILLQASTAIETARLFQQTQESESELRALFAAMEDVIFVVDKDTRYLRIAPTNPSGLYRPPEELLGQRMDQILPEETHTLFRDAINQVLTKNETVNIEYPLEIDNQETWFYASLSKLGENQVYWVARDITERKRSEKALQEAHARVELVLETTTVPTHITRISDGAFLYANQAVSDALRLPLDEIMGTESASFYFSEEEREEFLSAIREYGVVFNTEIRFVRGDGEMFWGLVSSRIFEYESEPALLSTVLDITDRKLAEKAIVRQNEYMAAAAEVGRLITSTLNTDMLFTRTVNLLREHFRYYHAAIFTIEETGFNAIVREATGEAGEEMKQRQHTLAVGSKSIVGTATSTGEPLIVNNTATDPNHHLNPLLPETKAEAAIPLKIGRRIIGALDLQATEIDAFTPEDVAVLQILADQIAVAIDNARSYKLAEDAVKEMREIDKLKSQFLANMSHELRTPLNSIIGFSRIILKGIDGPVTDLQQQDLTAIYNSGNHLLGLINDILDLSKIEAGKMELTFDEVDLEKLIKSVMSTVTGLVKDKPIRLVEKVASNLPKIHADPMRVRQILINLFSNAAKFTDEGTITVTANLEENQDGLSNILISVIDSGPGISKEDQEKLFLPFSQVDASATRKTGGTGLGLSICQQLVHMHGGEIGIDSSVGNGSTFYFTLPAHRVKDQQDDLGREQPDNRIILAIDDEPQIITLYQRYLQPQGYQVIGLTKPALAKERIKELKPYAVTLDIMMPGYDGWQVLTDIKSDPETHDIPVIICSILEDTKKGYTLGASDYIIKPIIEDDLMGALDRLNKDGAIHEVLVIDDDPDDLRLLGKLLSETDRYKPILAEGGRAGWDAIASHPPHVILLDLFMPELDGFKIIEKLKHSPVLKEIPVIVISGGDLTIAQQEKLLALNHHIIQKGSLNPDELIMTLEKSLKRIQLQ